MDLMRQAFEDYCRGAHGWPCDRTSVGDGPYNEPAVRKAWPMWRAAWQAATSRAVDVPEIPCESCGADCVESHDPADHKCHGCGRVVCQSCVDVFDHLEDGLHGAGDPSKEVRRLRATPPPDAAGERAKGRREGIEECLAVDVDTAGCESPCEALEKMRDAIRALLDGGEVKR